MIDRWELLRWLNSFDSQINDNTLSENAKKIHRGYMDEFRQHVIDMPDVKPKDRLLLGFEIGLWTELVIILIVLKITGTI